MMTLSGGFLYAPAPRWKRSEEKRTKSGKRLASGEGI
jgi:hypothetical protein